MRFTIFNNREYKILFLPDLVNIKANSSSSFLQSVFAKDRWPLRYSCIVIKTSALFTNRPSLVSKRVHQQRIYIHIVVITSFSIKISPLPIVVEFLVCTFCFILSYCGSENRKYNINTKKYWNLYAGKKRCCYLHKNKYPAQASQLVSSSANPYIVSYVYLKSHTVTLYIGVIYKINVFWVKC